MSSKFAVSRLVARDVSQRNFAARRTQLLDWIEAQPDEAIASDALLGAMGVSKDIDRLLVEARRIYQEAVTGHEDAGDGGGGTVDLTPVTDRLDEIEETLPTIGVPTEGRAANKVLSLDESVEPQWIDVSAVAPGYKGEWVSGTYQTGDQVKHDNDLWGANTITTQEPIEPIQDYAEDFSAGLPLPSFWGFSPATNNGHDTESVVDGSGFPAGSAPTPAFCLQISSDWGNSASSHTLTLDFEEAGTIAFDYAQTNDNSGWGFNIDSTGKASGSRQGWTHYEFTVSAGTHTFTWYYSRGSYTSNGQTSAVANIETTGSLVVGSSDWDLLVRGAQDIASISVPHYTTAERPDASTVGLGEMIYDSDLDLPLWSNGTDWKDGAGTVR